MISPGHGFTRCSSNRYAGPEPLYMSRHMIICHSMWSERVSNGRVTCRSLSGHACARGAKNSFWAESTCAAMHCTRLSRLEAREGTSRHVGHGRHSARIRGGQSHTCLSWWLAGRSSNTAGSAGKAQTATPGDQEASRRRAATTATCHQGAKRQYCTLLIIETQSVPWITSCVTCWTIPCISLMERCMAC